MTFYIHKTLRPPLNVLDVLQGNWYPGAEGPQFLLNLHTSFELYRIIAQPQNPRFYKFYQQIFMSKVYSICAGPKTNNISSFFALRDNDIIQLSYSDAEGLFALRIRLTLPSLLISSNVIYYSEPVLVVSSSRGSICAFDFSQQESKLAFCEKTAEAVLSFFPYRTGNLVARIESGPTVATFNKHPFSLNTKTSFPNEKVTCAFSLSNDSLVICVVGKVMIIGCDGNSNDVNLPVINFKNPDADRNDYIIQATYMDSESTLLLTALGRVYLFTNNGFHLVVQDNKFSQIFGLTGDLALFTLKGEEHRVQDVKTLKIATRLQSVVGLNGLYLGVQTHFLAPHTISYSNDLLILGRQGLNVITLSSVECAEPIYGTHSFSANGKNYVIVSFQNSSRLLEVKDNELRSSDSLTIKENVQTLGMCALTTAVNTTVCFHLTPDLLLIHGSNQVREYAMNSISAYASNSKQLIIAIANRQVRYFQTNSNPTQQQLESSNFEVQFLVNSLALSRQDKTTNLAEYVVYGATDSNTNSFSVKLYTISLDQSARQLIFSEKMPSKVVSMKFLDAIKLVVGLESGAFVVGNVDTTLRRLDSIATFQLGTGPLLLTPIPVSLEEHVLIALNSRPMLIQVQRSLPRFRPLAISSAGYAASLGDKGRFLLASGRTLSISTFSDTQSDTAISRFSTKANIVATCPIPKERFILVAVVNGLLVFDASKDNNFLTLDNYPEETVKGMSLGGPQQNLVGICSADGPDSSIIRIYYLTYSQTAVSITQPIFGRCRKVVNAICIGANNSIICGSGDTLFCFKQYKDTLQMAAQISGIGLNIRFLVYAPSTKQSKASIYVGDSSRSVKLIRFSEKNKQFKIICEEGCPRQITAMDLYEDISICGGDALGNVFIFEYPPIHLTSNAVLDPHVFKASKRISIKMNFFIGDAITGVHYTSDMFNCLWYTTISGELGGFISSPQNQPKEWAAEYQKYLRLLRAVEMEVSSTYMQLCGCDHIGHRNRIYSAANVIDMDMIEVFPKLSEERKRKIAKKIAELAKNKTNPMLKGYENLTPTIIEFEINRFRNYFINWQSK